MALGATCTRGCLISSSAALFPASSRLRLCLASSRSSGWEVSEGSAVCELTSSLYSPGKEWQTMLGSAAEVLKVEARRLDVPLLAPFEIASTKLTSVNNVAIRLELTDGSVGWGEVPILPPVTAEDQATALAKAAEVCSVLPGNPDSCLHILERITGLLPGHNFASIRAGMEMAFVDAVARRAGIPLWQLFGGHGNSVTTDITIPICTPEEAAVLAADYAKKDFNTLKVKIGGRSPSQDIALLRAVRGSHPDCSLILDANEGYTVDEALQVLRTLHEADLTPVLFEQPVGRENWAGLGHVCKVAKGVYGVSVAADESCRCPLDAQRIVDEGLADVINIKLAKVGLLAALQIVGIAGNAGVDLMIGGMVETRLAVGFAGNLAAGLGCFRFVDLDTPLLLAKDPVQGGYHVNGSVCSFSAPTGHGGSLLWP